jgi:hypothetical protein
VAAELGRKAPVSLRVNPNVDAKTHPYISTGLKDNKFGVAYEDTLATYRVAADLAHLDVLGIDCHIGSQLLDDAPLLEALDKVIELVDQLEALGITSISAAAWALPMTRKSRSQSATTLGGCSPASTPGATRNTRARPSRCYSNPAAPSSAMQACC